MKRLYIKKSKNGFTFVELVVTVALLSIVASLAIVGITSLSEMYSETTYEILLQKSSASAERAISDQSAYATGIELAELSPLISTSVFEDLEKQVLAIPSVGVNDTVVFVYGNDDNTYLQVCNVVLESVIVGGFTSTSKALSEVKKINYVSNVDFALSEYENSSKIKLSYTVKSVYQDNDDKYNYELTGTSPLVNLTSDSGSGKQILENESLKRFSLKNVLDGASPEVLILHHYNTSEQS